MARAGAFLCLLLVPALSYGKSLVATGPLSDFKLSNEFSFTKLSKLTLPNETPIENSILQRRKRQTQTPLSPLTCLLTFMTNPNCRSGSYDYNVNSNGNNNYNNYFQQQTQPSQQFQNYFGQQQQPLFGAPQQPQSSFGQQPQSQYGQRAQQEDFFKLTYTPLNANRFSNFFLQQKLATTTTPETTTTTITSTTTASPTNAPQEDEQPIQTNSPIEPELHQESVHTYVPYFTTTTTSESPSTTKFSNYYEPEKIYVPYTTIADTYVPTTSPTTTTTTLAPESSPPLEMVNNEKHLNSLKLLHQENVELRNQYLKLQEEVMGSDQQVKELHEHNENLVKQLDQYGKTFQQLQDSNLNLQQANQDLDLQYMNSNSENQKLQQKTRELDQKILESYSDRQSLQLQNEQCELKVVTYETKNENTQQQLNNSRVRAQQLERTNQDLQHQNGQLQHTIQDQKQTINSLKAINTQKEEQIERLHQQKLPLHQEIQQLKHSKGDLETLNKKLEVENRAAKAQIHQLEDKVKRILLGPPENIVANRDINPELSVSSTTLHVSEPSTTAPPIPSSTTPNTVPIYTLFPIIAANSVPDPKSSDPYNKDFSFPNFTYSPGGGSSSALDEQLKQYPPFIWRFPQFSRMFDQGSNKGIGFKQSQVHYSRPHD